MSKLLYATAVGIVVFMLVAAYLTFTRLSDNSINLMAGVVMGGLFWVPLSSVITWAVVKSRSTPTTINYQMRYMPQEPRYEPMPSPYSMQVAPYQQMQMTAPPMPQLTTRRHYVVGEEGEPIEL